jgi:ArsR family transcriptional regulator
MRMFSAPRKARHEEIASLFQVLGNPTRLRIIHDLATGEKCVCNIFRRLKLPQNLVSHHLGILRKRGIIHSRRAGKWVYYSINEELLEDVSDAVKAILNTPKGQAAC